MGECSKETAFEMLDFFYDQGGNFIDTYVISWTSSEPTMPSKTDLC